MNRSLAGGARLFAVGTRRPARLRVRGGLRVSFLPRRLPRYESSAARNSHCRIRRWSRRVSRIFEGIAKVTVKHAQEVQDTSRAGSPPAEVMVEAAPDDVVVLEFEGGAPVGFSRAAPAGHGAFGASLDAARRGSGAVAADRRAERRRGARRGGVGAQGAEDFWLRSGREDGGFRGAKNRREFRGEAEQDIRALSARRGPRRSGRRSRQSRSSTRAGRRWFLCTARPRRSPAALRSWPARGKSSRRATRAAFMASSTRRSASARSPTRSRSPS